MLFYLSTGCEEDYTHTSLNHNEFSLRIKFIRHYTVYYYIDVIISMTFMFFAIFRVNQSISNYLRLMLNEKYVKKFLKSIKDEHFVAFKLHSIKPVS